MYDRDLSRTIERYVCVCVCVCVDHHCSDNHSSSGWEEEGLLYSSVKGLQAQSKPHYQALIDTKDFPYIVS